MTCTLQQNHIQFNEQQLFAIRQCLQNDLKACDIKWSLFVAAAQGFRYVSKLKPYPPQFMHNDDQLNIERIQHVIAIAPPFSTIHKLLVQQQYETLPRDLIELLHWLLVTLSDPILKTVPKNQYHDILNKVQSIDRGPKPTYIFECIPTSDAVKERNFQQHAKDRRRLYAFHGSKLDSFHSILNYGLQQHLCKEALFGEGIYLSSEMHVSLLYSSIGTGWSKSGCGKTLSCMAVCEFIEHPDHLRCRTKGKWCGALCLPIMKCDIDFSTLAHRIEQHQCTGQVFRHNE